LIASADKFVFNILSPPIKLCEEALKAIIMKKRISRGSWVKKNFSQKNFKKFGKHVLNIFINLNNGKKKL
jgi:hypothetical protein